ncbi:MAG: PAS domain S-box protein [Treponema sp.]|nr:PAS domain S-box protein [Treponema sp.]
MKSENQKTILVVEDEAIIALLEKKQLEGYGYAVHHVNSGEKAVKAIIDDALPADLILMDIDLGSGIDGTQAAQQILDHKDVPIVFLSSHTEPEVVEKTEKITSYGYVVKNSGIVVLDASIKMAIKLFHAKTERKHALEQLRKSEELYKNLFDSIPESVLLIGADRCVVEANRASASLHGYQSPEELIGFDTRLLISSKDRERASQVQTDVLSGKETAPRHYTEVRRDGSEFIGEIISTTLYDPKGEVLGYIGITRDITTIVQAEELLRESRQRLELATSSAQLGIWDWDIVNNSMLWDDQMFKLYGIAERPDSFGVEFWKKCIHPDDLSTAWEACEAALRDEKKYDIAFRVVHPDGTIRLLKGDGLVVRGTDRSAIRMIGINQDITEHGRAE